MKKIFLLLSAVMMTVGVMAENKLPRDFFGVQLGKSTLSEVANTITRCGGKEVKRDSTEILYKLRCMHEGTEFSSIRVVFINDTLYSFAFVDSCGGSCTSAINTLVNRFEHKYPALDHMTPDSTSETKSLGLTDDSTLVIINTKSGGYHCVYSDFAKLSSMYVSLAAIVTNYDDNKVTGIAGVKFGDSKASVKKVIDAKADKLLESDAHSINYCGVKIGGIDYDYAKFFFSAEKGLVSVNLQKPFYSWQEEEAILTYESLKAQYSRKYTNLKVRKDEKDAKICACGIGIDGSIFPIFITLSKGVSHGGSIMYYVQVDYYYRNRSSMYDDEI